MRIIFVLVFLCIPMMGFAQRVTVRSGEHADFSRLAFEFPDTVEWEMGRVDKGYEIRLNGVEAEIDISEVFKRIPHDRIKSLAVSDNNTRVTLILGCECYADAFEFRPGLLVVDVKDGEPSVTSRFEVSFHSGELIAEQKEGVVEPEKTVIKPEASTGDDRLVSLPFNFPKSQTATKTRIGIFGVGAAERKQEPTQQVVEMQSEILQQIGRAASQGLLDANITYPAQAVPSNPETAEDIVQKPQVPIAKPHINIHIESSIDREFLKFINQGLMTENGTKCLPGKLFNIEEWGDEEAVFTKISEHRSKVAGEFDKIDAGAVRQLVEAYIYAGFGVEALSVLSDFDVKLKNEKILTEMAQIVDGITPNQQSELIGQIGCDTAAALWAALSEPTLSKQLPINGVAIRGAFSGLPIHLRRLLGPRLAQKFLDIGDIDTARALRNAIARAPGDAGSEFHLLDAQLDIERGQKASAEHTLEEIIINDKEIAPRALVKLLEVRLHNRERIDPQVLETANSYVFEQRNSKSSADLKRLIALSYAQSGDFTKALDALNQMEQYEQIGSQKKAITWGLVVENLAMDASETTLLKFVYSAQDELASQGISREVRRKLAKRLLKEGWPVEAEMVLAAPSSPTTDDQVILAQAEFFNGHAESVLRSLENVAGDEAGKLRALAYEKLGKYFEAAQEYKMLNDGDNQKSATWRAADWMQLAEIGSKTDREVAKVMLQPSQAVDIEADARIGTLAFGSSLLLKSEEERQLIQRLLEEYPILEKEG